MKARRTTAPPIVSEEVRALYEEMMREASAYTDAIVAGAPPPPLPCLN